MSSAAHRIRGHQRSGARSRRKRETVGLTNERDFPHLVELTFPPGGFRSAFLEIDEVEQFYIRFCFPDIAAANAFRNRLGGERLTHAGTSVPDVP
jgi:hypothetical protein